jgi:hypothetical protein
LHVQPDGLLPGLHGGVQSQIDGLPLRLLRADVFQELVVTAALHVIQHHLRGRSPATDIPPA